MAASGYFHCFLLSPPGLVYAKVLVGKEIINTSGTSLSSTFSSKCPAVNLKVTQHKLSICPGVWLDPGFCICLQHFQIIP